MNEALFTHRDERFRFELLDSNDAFIEELDGVEGGQLDFSIYNTIRSGGSLNVVENQTVDWMASRVKVYYVLATEAGDVEWPLGVFIPAAPVATINGSKKSKTVELYDKMLILQQDAFDETYVVAAGANVTDAVRSIIESTGEDNISITDSDETLSTTMFWPAGETKLRAVNDLLAAINYFSIWCDGNGQYRAEPYQAPASRPLAHTFADDENGLYVPSFTVDADTFDVPNKVILVVSNPEEELVSVATNTDPDSPFSYANRGRWIVKVDKADATSQDVLDGIAERRLVEASQVASTVDITHAWLPIYLNNVVGFTSSESGTSGTFAVVKQNITLKDGVLPKTTLREVMV